MAEYIEREAVRNAILGEHPDMHYPSWYANIIDSIPVADVAPVVHGEWLLKHIGAGHYWECSICHTNPCIYVTQHTKFCPNCGAKMDGGVNEC
jgi:hypothetical protein